MDNFTGLHWLASLLATSTGFNEPMSTDVKKGNAVDVAADCLSYVKQQLEHDKAAITMALVEHYIQPELQAHRAKLIGYGESMIRSCNTRICKAKASHIALERTMSVEIASMSASEIVQTFDIQSKKGHIKKQSYIECWQPHINWLTGRYLQHLAVADMHVRDYKNLHKNSA